jgi:thiol-disulfide isomerase/thioredoxin/alpha-beta hydrolase superfamily lysophospholipase
VYANFARVWLVLALTLAWLPRGEAAVLSQSFTTAGGAEIPLLHFPAKGRAAVLWLPSESGLLQQEQQAAAALAKAGVEVWYADLFSAYFLPTLGSSFAKMPPADVAALIDRLRHTTGKRVYLLSAGRGALLALRAAHRWQEEHPRAKPLGGAILISPKLYVRTPEPGLEGQLMPVVTATNLPLLILQPEKSIWRWKMKRIVPALSRGGSDVFVWYLPGVRDRFYYRQDASAAEDAMARRLPTLIEQALPMLRTAGGKPRPPVAITAKARGESLAERTDRRLRPFRGDPHPPALRLTDLDGRVHDLTQYRGKVVLVNFWATWCPPCVHEMPSIERLKHKMAGRPFKILAVNMAEDRGAVERFLHHVVNVDFTVLLDSDGAALSRWKVFAFPTTYVVGKHGRIRYALFGSIEWDNPDVLHKLDRLLRE